MKPCKESCGYVPDLQIKEAAMLGKMAKNIIFFAVFFCLDATTLVAANDTVVQGKIISQFGAVQGAHVRVPGNAQMVTTNQQGHFTLPISVSKTGKLVISAGKEGWFNNSASVSPGNRLVPLRLYPVPRQDNSRYRFISPVQCSQCHNTLTRYWDQSKMAHTTSNPKVINMYDGSSASQRLAGPGYQVDNPEKIGTCAVCHAPSAAVTEGISKDLKTILRSNKIEWDGVSCDYCHKVNKVIRDDSSPSRMKPLFRRQQAPKANSILAFGPYDDVVNGIMAASYSPVYEKSVFCATCHDHFETLPNNTTWDRKKVYSDDEWNGFDLEDTRRLPVQTTYREWKLWQTSLQPGDPDLGKNCQSCHMSWRKDMLPYDEHIVDGRAREVMGTKRDPTTIHPHQFDGTTPTQLKSALALEIEAETQDTTFTVKIHVTNVAGGHWVPTGETMRSIMLLVNGTDSKGAPLAMVSGETLPDWAGQGLVEEGNYGGLPGAMFAKVLRDGSNRLNVPFWKAVAVDSDTRIRPKTTITKEFQFSLTDPNDEPSVEARLVYRPAFKALADAKGWKDIDITITSSVW